MPVSFRHSSHTGSYSQRTQAKIINKKAKRPWEVYSKNNKKKWNIIQQRTFLWFLFFLWWCRVCSPGVLNTAWILTLWTAQCLTLFSSCLVIQASLRVPAKMSLCSATIAWGIVLCFLPFCHKISLLKKLRDSVLDGYSIIFWWYTSKTKTSLPHTCMCAQQAWMIRRGRSISFSLLPCRRCHTAENSSNASP